jgi:hypothetical protein
VIFQREDLQGRFFDQGDAQGASRQLEQIDFRQADLLDLDAMKSACAGVDYVLPQAVIP